MGSARLYGTRRLKNRRVIQSLFERPSVDDGGHVIRRGLVSARYRLLTPGRTASAPGRSASMRMSESARRAESERFQFGVAVGRRTGNAGSRNTVKRILRERIRLRQAELDEAIKTTARTAEEPTDANSQRGVDRTPPFLVMMLVSSGTSADAAQIHGDTDRVISALIEELTA